MKERLRIVVLGILGKGPFAGMAWQGLHYLEGLRRLGHDVYYVEDTGEWPYDPEKNTITDDCRYAVRYLSRTMACCGMSDRWAYRSAADGATHGIPERRLACLFDEADILVNLSAATVLRPEHLRVPVRIYLETDPVLPQIQAAQGHQFTLGFLAAHTHHFTFAENLGRPDCGVPNGGVRYFPTRQPVVLDWWKPDPGAVVPAAPRFTTIANWRQTGKDVEWNGETYTWSKHIEFLKFIDLPGRIRQPLELALAGGDEEAGRLLASRGWSAIDAFAVSRDILPYRDYILGSSGEFTVAKDQNVRLQSGWFSDRSACYLAAGHPVVTQNTGFGCALPTGEGLFAFDTLDEIVAAFERIEANYERQSRAARAIAEDYFRAETVLSGMLHHLGY
jgi:hypothetical protein